MSRAEFVLTNLLGKKVHERRTYSFYPDLATADPPLRTGTVVAFQWEAQWPELLIETDEPERHLVRCDASAVVILHEAPPAEPPPSKQSGGSLCMLVDADTRCSLRFFEGAGGTAAPRTLIAGFYNEWDACSESLEFSEAQAREFHAILGAWLAERPTL